MSARISKVESDHFLHQAIVEANAPIVERYLSEGGTPNVIDGYDCEPLYTAVKYGRLKIARMLLTAGGNIARRSKLRGTPWGAAVWNWRIKMIDFCLSAGVDVNHVEDNETALDWLDGQFKSYDMTGEGMKRWRRARDRLVKRGGVNFRDLPIPKADQS